MRALVLHWGRNGGGPRFAADAVTGLRAAGVWTALSYSRQSERAALDAHIADAGVPVDTFNNGREAILRAPSALRGAMKIARFVESHRIDCVFAAMEQIWQPAPAWALRRSGVPYLLGVHDAAFHPGDRSPLQVATRALESSAADGILTFSEAVDRDVAGSWRFPRDRIWKTVLPVRVNTPVGRTLAGQSGVVRIGFFGRIQPYKGVRLLVDAARLLEEQGVPVEIEIRGEGDDPALDVLLPRSITVVQTWTPEEQIESVVASYDVLVAPYVEASQSGVVPLAAALGVPAIVTPAGGLGEQVLHEVTGLVTARIDAASLAAAMRRLIEDSELRARLGESARSRSVDASSIDRFGAETAIALEQLVALGKRA